MGSSQGRHGRLVAVCLYVSAWFASAQGGDPPFVFVERQTPRDGVVWWAVSEPQPLVRSSPRVTAL